MPRSVLVTASILAADLARLQEEIDSVEPYADWLQVDVMDGHFVPALSFGAPVLRSLKTGLPIDIHLMVTNPADRIDEFVKVGASNITFHEEAVTDPDEQRALIETIRSRGCTAGIAINPETPVDAIEHFLSTGAAKSTAAAKGRAGVDLVLCMTVHPGFSGQKFEEGVLPKIREVRERNPDVIIQADGGIDPETGKRCREAGATNLVAASYIFGSKDREQTIRSLRE